MRLNTNFGLVDGVELGVGGAYDPPFLQVFMFMSWFTALKSIAATIHSTLPPISAKFLERGFKRFKHVLLPAQAANWPLPKDIHLMIWKSMLKEPLSELSNGYALSAAPGLQDGLALFSVVVQG